MYYFCGCIRLWILWWSSFFLNPIFLFYQDILILWPRDSTPWSCIISTGHRYRTIHVVSTKFSIIVAVLSLYWVISNRPVVGSVIVTAFKIKGYFPFLRIFWGPKRSTHSLFNSISHSVLASNLLFFLPFCMLTYITLCYFFYGVSYVMPVQVLSNHCLRSIPYRMKEICVIPFHNVSLEFLWNYYSIFIRYKFYSITASAKITLFIFSACKFFR